MAWVSVMVMVIGQFSLTTKLTLTVTLTLTDTVMLISQTKLSGELVPERMAAYHRVDGFKSSAG